MFYIYKSFFMMISYVCDNNKIMILDDIKLYYDIKLCTYTVLFS